MENDAKRWKVLNAESPGQELFLRELAGGEKPADRPLQGRGRRFESCNAHETSWRDGIADGFRKTESDQHCRSSAAVNYPQAAWPIGTQEH